jgi:hypothetical protein
VTGSGAKASDTSPSQSIVLHLDPPAFLRAIVKALILLEKMVLPDRIELRLQSWLILILLYFSARRSVFVWHSWVAPCVKNYHTQDWGAAE